MKAATALQNREREWKWIGKGRADLRTGGRGLDLRVDRGQRSGEMLTYKSTLRTASTQQRNGRAERWIARHQTVALNGNPERLCGVGKQILAASPDEISFRVEQGEAQRGVKGAALLTKAPRRRRCFSAPTRDEHRRRATCDLINVVLSLHDAPEARRSADALHVYWLVSGPVLSSSSCRIAMMTGVVRPEMAYCVQRPSRRGGTRIRGGSIAYLS